MWNEMTYHLNCERNYMNRLISSVKCFKMSSLYPQQKEEIVTKYSVEKYDRAKVGQWHDGPVCVLDTKNHNTDVLVGVAYYKISVAEIQHFFQQRPQPYAGTTYIFCDPHEMDTILSFPETKKHNIRFLEL